MPEPTRPEAFSMSDRICAIIGIVIILAFAGGIAWKVGSPPLLIITTAVLAMAVFDVVRTLRDQTYGRQF
jgi:hypothetical protein